LLLPSDDATAAAVDDDLQYKPLSPGDPLRAYLPYGLSYKYKGDGISVYEPGREADTFYHRCPAPEQVTREYAKRVREILIAGEVRGSYYLFFFV
jgi:hypothetical protein